MKKKESIKLRRVWKSIFLRREDDPSLLDQLRERGDLREGEVMTSYLNACEKAPFASAQTKRRWRKALGL